jgi:hypothetical protein
MHRNLLATVTLVIGMIVFVSCGGSDKHAIAVPKDAAFVFHLNTPSLSTKLSWSEIKATNWFKEMTSKNDDSIAQQLLDNPESSGIDTKADLVFFAKRQGQRGYCVLQGTLKDAAAFEAFNKKTNKEATSAKDGDLNILKDNDVTITWNSNRFMYLFDAPWLAKNNRFGMEGMESSSGASGKLTSDSLVKFAKTLYSLDGDNSLFSDKRFDALIKENGDMHLWINAEQAYSGAMGEVVNMFSGISKLFEGNVTAGTISFDDGKIGMKTKSYYNKDLAKIYEKYKMKNVEASVLKSIPSQNITGVFTFNYPPEGIPELLKLVGADGVANNYLSELNITVADFVKANKGDVLLAVTDFDLKKQTMTVPGMDGKEGGSYTSTRPDLQVLFAASINDRPAFEKMISSLKEKMGDLSGQGGLPPISYSLNDKWFAASTSQQQVNQFLAGGDNKWAAASKLAGHPAIFYVDLQKVLKPMSDSTSAMVNESLKMWEDVLFYGGEINDGAMNSTFEVNLVDKGTNSLKQLNQYIDRMAATRHHGAF